MDRHQDMVHSNKEKKPKLPGPELYVMTARELADWDKSWAKYLADYRLTGEAEKRVELRQALDPTIRDKLKQMYSGGASYADYLKRALEAACDSRGGEKVFKELQEVKQNATVQLLWEDQQGLISQMPDEQMFFLKCKSAVHCDCNRDLDRWLYRDALRTFKRQLREPEVYEKTEVKWLESSYPESRDHSQKQKWEWYTHKAEINAKIIKNNKDALGEERGFHTQTRDKKVPVPARRSSAPTLRGPPKTPVVKTGNCRNCGTNDNSDKGFTRDIREKHCKAYNKECKGCGKKGHYQAVCSTPGDKPPQAREDRKGRMDKA